MFDSIGAQCVGGPSASVYDLDCTDNCSIAFAPSFPFVHDAHVFPLVLVSLSLVSNCDRVLVSLSLVCNCDATHLLLRI